MYTNCKTDSTDKVETSLEWREYFSQFPRYDWCAPLSHPSSFMLVNHGPYQQSSKEEYKPWKWGATTHLIQRPCYQRGNACQDPAGDWTTGRTPDHRKETQTAVVWSCLPFIRSGQNHLARHSERGKKTRQTEEEVGRQHQDLEFGKSQRAVENREKWRKLVAELYVVPQQPSRLRDRWWWWWLMLLPTVWDHGLSPLLWDTSPSPVPDKGL